MVTKAQGQVEEHEPTAGGGRRKHEREEWDDERMKTRRRYLANVREQVRMETELEALSGARQAVRELKKLARGARDERARYSAAAKLVEIAMPKEAVPLVNLNIGTNYTSHLGLPPPPAVFSFPPAPEVKALIEAPAPRIVDLPEPEVMPTQIGPEEPVSIEKIGPEDAQGRGYQRQTIDISARHASPEVTKIDGEQAPKPFDGSVKAIRDALAEHPLPVPYPTD
jgi:hypothetical protein